MTKPRLTNKQANAITNMVGNGGNITKAMKDAGYSPATAHTPSKLTKSPAVREAIKLTNQELAIKHELTLDEAYRLIAEAKGAAKMDQFTGEIIPDYTTRLKVASMILKLHDLQALDPPPNPLLKDLNEDTDLIELVQNKAIFRQNK